MWVLGTELEQSGRAEYSLSGTTSPALVTELMPCGHSCVGLGAVVGLLDHGSVALVAVVNCGLCLH